MSTRITIRLPDDMVAFLDRTVAMGKAPSRSALVASALEREMRRLTGEQDALILVSTVAPAVTAGVSLASRRARVS